MKEEKKIIRLYIKDLKNKYLITDFKQKSELILKKIEMNTDFIHSKIVLIYWSMDNEVSTIDFINKWQNEKMFLLPVIQKDVLVLKKFQGIEKMIAEPKFGILEPVGEVFVDFKNIDFVIVPGVAFDKNLNRLGYGKGYYDKLLPKIHAKKVAICFDFQIIDEVPVEDFDVKMDSIYTNSSVISI